MKWLILLTLASCTPTPRDDSGRPVATKNYYEICLGGWVYYRGLYRLTPKYGPDAKLVPCEAE